MRFCVLAAILLIAVAGCASQTKNSPQHPPASVADGNAFTGSKAEIGRSKADVPDPLEPLNQVMGGIDEALYFGVIKPIAQVYKAVIPKPARICVGNFFYNLATPARLVNCLAQGKSAEADTELRRFALNTTAGVLGFGDPARDRWGLKPPAEEDLGQTLAVYGFDDGFYIIWPIFGPSTLRDSVGMVGDWFLNPVSYVEPDEASIGISATGTVSEESFHLGEYEAFKAASVDTYAAVRTAYIQYRRKQIAGEVQPRDPNTGSATIFTGVKPQQ